MFREKTGMRPNTSVRSLSIYELETKDIIIFGPRGIAQWCCDMHLEFQHQPVCALCETSRMLIWGLSAHIQTTLALWVQIQWWCDLLAFELLCSNLCCFREVAIPEASRSHRESRRQWLMVDFSDHVHSLPENPGVARFLGTRTHWETFLILFLWKLWMDPWVLLWCKSLCFIANRWHLISAAPLALHLSPPRLVLENIFILS